MEAEEYLKDETRNHYILKVDGRRRLAEDGKGFTCKSRSRDSAGATWSTWSRLSQQCFPSQGEVVFLPCTTP